MKPARDALTPDRVLQAALALADEHGLASLSMRRLGTELGVEAMSLYRHVPNKEALLDAMVDAIVQSWVAESDLELTDWRRRLSAIMHRAHDSLIARPWAVELIAARPATGEGRLHYAETITAAVLEAGFTPQLAHHALHIVDGTIMGFSAQEARRPSIESLTLGVQTFYDLELRHQFPNVSTVMRAGHQHAEEYALMVDLVIDGLARLRGGLVPPRSGSGAHYVITFA